MTLSFPDLIDAASEMQMPLRTWVDDIRLFGDDGQYRIEIGFDPAAPDYYADPEYDRRFYTWRTEWPMPETTDELRAQIIATLTVGMLHEASESVTDGGKVFLEPHPHDDTPEWDILHGEMCDAQSAIFQLVKGYADRHPATTEGR